MTIASRRVCIQIHKAQTIKWVKTFGPCQPLINRIPTDGTKRKALTSHTGHQFIAALHKYPQIPDWRRVCVSLSECCRFLLVSLFFLVWVLQAAALLLGVAVAHPHHDALQAGLHDAEQGPQGGVPVPAGLHQLPALLVETGQALRPGSCREATVRCSKWDCAASRSDSLAIEEQHLEESSC